MFVYLLSPLIFTVVNVKKRLVITHRPIRLEIWGQILRQYFHELEANSLTICVIAFIFLYICVFTFMFM